VRLAPGAEHLARAERALQGVGDADAGQWVEVGVAAMHLRRRLSAAEVSASGLVVRDVRGTPEAELRLALVRHLLPAGYTEG
jgi:hypothetical protein